jgi:cyclophilin family peptidyl-prolyl cis-trans isomerase
LVAALGAKEPGVVAEAARVLSASPGRGSNLAPGEAPEDPKAVAAPTRDVVEALAKALDAPRPPDQIETRVALARAAARLGVLSLKPRVERFCTSDNVTVRHAAEEAMRVLGSQDAHCNAPKVTGPRPIPVPTGAATSGPLTLTFVTDAGRLGLTLDPTLAPLAVSRVAELAASGFYDGLAIQRVSPGYLVQFGDPVGDGYGGSGKPPVPSETSPLEFPLLSVGLAESGRDTGSSQIFVTLSPEPTLYGDYPILGWADREWATAAEGDVIRSVEVKR